MLRGNTIIQTVTDDYEREKHFEESRHFAEGMKIVEIVTTSEDTKGNARSGDKTRYSLHHHNSLKQRVIDSYECYEHSMRADEFTQVTSNPVQGGERQPVMRIRPPTSSRLMDVVSSRDSKIGFLSVDGQIAEMEFEQFTTSDVMGEGNSVSGDEDTTGMWRTSEEISPTSIRYDVAVSALITPETWDKKVQFDSSNFFDYSNNSVDYRHQFCFTIFYDFKSDSYEIELQKLHSVHLRTIR
nr:hypothetical transcript [Hymenolepis microstoma]